MALLHGGKLAAKALKEAGVECIFTLSGGHIMSLYDGCLDEGIKIVDVRHEQAAVHAADSWARCNPGKVGVAAITAGVSGTDIAFDGTTLTFTGGGDTTFDFTVTAQDDTDVEGVEDVNVQLTNDTVVFGTSSIGTDQAEVEITELDAAVTFDISVTPGSISEDLEEAATFTVTMSGALAVGNTATVDIALIADGDGDTQAADGVDYLDALPFFIQEVLPRLQRLGVRT